MVLVFEKKKIRKELVLLYESFLSEPGNGITEGELIRFDRDYGGLSSYNDCLKDCPIPNDIVNALGYLSAIYQYGWGLHNDKELIVEAKIILKDLKKNLSFSSSVTYGYCLVKYKI